MKNKELRNSNGIAICDSIIMSVKKKRLNFSSMRLCCDDKDVLLDV